MADFIEDGIRPVLSSKNGCTSCDQCVQACPGISTEHDLPTKSDDYMTELKEGWGPILEMWEGYAADQEFRYYGSSGGLATAIALYCLEREGISGILHTGADPSDSLKNITMMSHNRSDLLSRTGSRYSPASPCDGLSRIESAPGPCVFIGKPCDIAGLRKAQLLRENLNRKIGLSIGIFCAGTPSTRGTMELLKHLNIDPGAVEDIRYRGKGWPGEATVRLKGEEKPSGKLSYMESWGFLQKYRPYRCYLCPDGTSELADIACGDPWYREIHQGESGYSLALVRTEKGRRILHGAMEVGYVSLKPAESKILVLSQKNLLEKRKTIWGRLIAMKLFLIPTPHFTGFFLFKNWNHLSLKNKIRSVLGTIRRIVQRKYYTPSDYFQL